MAGETETVGLALSGGFAADALKDAAAAELLARMLEKLGKTSPSIKADTAGIDKTRAALRGAAADAAKWEHVLAGAKAREASLSKAIDPSASRGAQLDVIQAKLRAGFQVSEAEASLTKAKAAAAGEALRGEIAAANKTIGELHAEETAASKSVGTGADKLAGSSSLLERGGSMLAGGAAALGAAAAALAAAGGVAILAGVKLGIEATDKARMDRAVMAGLDKRAGGGKGAAYELGIEVAGNLGISEEEAMGKVKRLLNSGMRGGEVLRETKTAAGIDQRMGAGTGDEYLAALQKMRLEPKIVARDLKSLAKMGIDTKLVLAELGTALGVSAAEAAAKIKAGQVDSQAMIRATETVADKSFGKIGELAGHSIPGMINKIRLAAGEMFKGLDISPVQGALGNALAVLTGPAGKKLGKAGTKLGNTLIQDIFGPFDGPAGKKKIDAAVTGITVVFDRIEARAKQAAPYIQKAIDLLGQLVPEQNAGHVKAVKALGVGGDTTDAKAQLQAEKVVEDRFMSMFEGQGQKDRRIKRAKENILAGKEYDGGFDDAPEYTAGKAKAAAASKKGFFEKGGLLDMLSGSEPANDAKAADVGKGIDAGLVAGMEAGKAAVAAKGAELGKAATDGTAKGAEVHSPSRAGIRIGGFVSAGVGLGMAAGAPGAARAGAAMAAGSLAAIQATFGSAPKALRFGMEDAAPARAVRSAGAAALAATGAPPAPTGGAPSYSVSITNNWPKGSGTDAASAREIARANANEWDRRLRAKARGAREGTAR